MSREHFHESQIEDKVEKYMQEGMSDEDAIQKAESEYHGQVNLVEEQALKINKRQVAFQKALRQGCYPSEIVLAMVVDHLQEHYQWRRSRHHHVERCILSGGYLVLVV